MISEWFSDDELISQLAMFFTVEEKDNIDFVSALGTVAEVDKDTLQVQVKDKCFRFNRFSCDVEEVT